MNLIVDAGNTFVKIAVFQNNSLLEKQCFEKELFSKKIENIMKDYPEIDYSIISSVTSGDLEMVSVLKKNFKVLELDDAVSLPFKNKYGTLKTLGKDRIALVASAVKTYPGKNVLVIDMGTCITYDFKNSEENYLGGAISPGMQMRFKSLHKFTANLPLITPKPEAELIGDSTENSILSGIINGIRMEKYSTTL